MVNSFATCLEWICKTSIQISLFSPHRRTLLNLCLHWLNKMSARRIQPNTLHCDLKTVTMILRSRLDHKEAVRRAQMLVEDIPRLGGPLRLRWIGQTSREAWPYYIFKNNTVTPEVFHLSSHSICKSVGYGLNWGDLVTFSKAVKVARQLWGQYWARWFRERMTHFHNHISTVEELVDGPVGFPVAD